MGLMFSLRFMSDVELKSVADRFPEKGLNVSFVEDTLEAVIVPDVIDVNIGKKF